MRVWQKQGFTMRDTSLLKNTNPHSKVLNAQPETEKDVRVQKTKEKDEFGSVHYFSRTAT